jgi:alpha-L-fucosidase
MGVETRDGFESDEFERPTPQWFRDAKLGLFVHWGAYAVPAWAEPIGALGTIPGDRWYRHNPYAEWYANTIRIPESPAAAHHLQTHGGRPYDDFLDDWHAELFDADEIAELAARAGARYLIPTTKHHDGIPLWDAPGSRGRHTVARGPRRDLVAEFASATRRAGLRFGVYYSGGLDWGFTAAPPIVSDAQLKPPPSARYATYAHAHVRDLIDRYSPDILWNDIGWPSAPYVPGLAALLTHYYARVPDGVVNDRWSGGHSDFATSEYSHNRSSETAAMWENCRGLGYSFGYNAQETDAHLLTGSQAVRLLVDVVSRGGNLLLNVGPRADGTVPEGQRRTLEDLGEWISRFGDAIYGSQPLPGVAATDDPWVRWTRTGTAFANLFVHPGVQEIRAPREVRERSARTIQGEPVSVERVGTVLRLSMPAHPQDAAVALPTVVRFELRAGEGQPEA